MPEPWVERQRRLARPQDWTDDEDILDAHDRWDATDAIDPTGATLTPVEAATIVATPRKQHWVNPYVALLDEITRTNAYVILLEQQVNELDANGGAHRSGRAAQQTLARFERERDRLVAGCKTAISLGIAERQIKLAERQGELMSRAAIAAVDATPGLDPEQRRALLTNLALQLRAIGPPST